VHFPTIRDKMQAVAAAMQYDTGSTVNFLNIIIIIQYLELPNY